MNQSHQPKSQHQMSTSDTSTQAPKPKKYTNACEQCRQLHRKCSGENPCATCRAKGIACIYTARKKRGPKRDVTKRLREEIMFLRQQLSQKSNTFVDSFVDQHVSKRSRYNLEQSSMMLVPANPTMNSSNSVSGVGMESNYFSTCIQGSRLYMTSLLSQFTEIYSTYVHPYHPLLPVHPNEFNKTIPSIIDAVISRPKENMELAFLFYSMLTTSARIIGDNKLHDEYLHKARTLAGELFDKTNLLVGHGFCILSYDALGSGDIDKCVSYTTIANRICDTLGSSDHELYMNCLLSMAYVSPKYETRLKFFREMGAPNQKAILGDLIFSLVGEAETKLLFDRDLDYNSILATLDSALKLLTAQAREKKQVEFLHELATFGCMTRALHRAGLKKMAVDWANKVLELSSSKTESTRDLLTPKGDEFYYCCVGVVHNAMEAAAEVHYSQGMTSALKRDIQVLKQLGNRYPLCSQLAAKYEFKLQQSANSIKPQNVIIHSNINQQNKQLTLQNAIQQQRFTQQSNVDSSAFFNLLDTSSNNSIDQMSTDFLDASLPPL